jgi:fucose permease
MQAGIDDDETVPATDLRPIDTEPGKPQRLLQITGYYSFLLLGWSSLLLPSLIRSVEHAFGRSDADFALLYFLSSLAYAAAAFTGGFLTERVGRRVVLVAALLVAAIGAVGQALSPSWVLLLIAIMFGAWGSGSIDGGVNALFLDVYRDARGGALSFLHLFFGLGALIGPFCIGLAVTAGMNWRLALLFTGAAFLIGVPIMTRVPMPSGRHAHETDNKPAEHLNETERSLLPFAGLAVGIGFYVAAEIGVSSWLVQFLSGVSVAAATAVLSGFWGGLSLGRFLSGWIADRMDYYAYTIGCIVLASLSLIGAVIVPWLPLSALLFALTGMFFGPIFPMIMTLGGNIYPHRLAALGGSLTTAAVVGGLIYPPLMGILESRIGLSGGMIGAALLGIPMAGAVLFAQRTASQR